MKSRSLLSVLAASLVAGLAVPFPAQARSPYEACLRTAENLFRTGTNSELAAIRACRGTTRREDVDDCLELADRLWRNGSGSEIAALNACQYAPRESVEEVSDTLDTDFFGAATACLEQAESSTRSGTLEELISIQACGGLTTPIEVADCLERAEDLWRDGSEAEIAGLSACQVALDQ